MKRIMISAMSSGSGKTVLTCALLKALSKRGINAGAFKCGPDYIDPMYHEAVLGVPSYNLDLFLQGGEGVRNTIAGSGAGFGVIEGVMGFYDGLGGTSRASAWDIADKTDTPVLLALHPKGQSLTLAAQIQGMLRFRKDSHIRGVILTDVTKGLYEHLKPLIEEETGLEVPGYLPHIKEAEIPSRYLGLMTPEETEDLEKRFEILAGKLEECADIDAIIRIAGEAPELGGTYSGKEQPESGETCTIAVAKDRAFSFYYRENLECLERAGASLVFFSPMSDEELPVCDGLYIGGGYPELFIKELSENESMKKSVRESILSGMPVVAECGGFMYLQETLRDTDERDHNLAGVFPGTVYKTGKLKRFGYLEISAGSDSLLFRKGEMIPAHEFHYWDSDRCGDDLEAVRAGGRRWRFGYAGENVYAGFPHLHFGGEIPMAVRFADAARAYKKKRTEVL